MENIPNEVNGVLSAINASKGHPIAIYTNGDVWTIEEKTTKIPYSTGIGKKKKLLHKIVTTTEKGKLLGNIYCSLDILPIPSKEFVTSISGKKSFFQFGNATKDKTADVYSTNFTRNVQGSAWQDSIHAHPEFEIDSSPIPTRYGTIRIFYFPDDEVTVVSNLDYEIREVIYKSGFEVMNLNSELLVFVKSEVERYKLGNGDVIPVKVTRTKHN